MSIYLIYELVTLDTKWAAGETDHFLAVVEHDFTSPLSERELKITRGQNLRLAPASHQPPNVTGWVLASDGIKIGLVPVNYIKVLGKRHGNPVPTPIAPTINYSNFPNVNNNNTNYSRQQPRQVIPLAQVISGETPSISRSSSESTLKGGAETPTMTKSFIDESEI